MQLRRAPWPITDPGESEDFGNDWADPSALTGYGEREVTDPWAWPGPPTVVTGPTWGGCIEAIQWILTAGRFPTDAAVLDGGVLIAETSEELISAREFRYILRSLGERGLRSAAAALLVARRQSERWTTASWRRREPPTATSSATPPSRSSVDTTLTPSYA